MDCCILLSHFIGGDDNQNVKIRKGMNNGEERERKDYPGILSADEYRNFWITWFDNIFHVHLCTIMYQ